MTTVGEFITQLQQLPPDSPLVLGQGEGGPPPGTKRCATCRHRGNATAVRKALPRPWWKAALGLRPSYEEPHRARGKLACLHPDCLSVSYPLVVLDHAVCSEWEEGNDHIP